MIGDTIKLLRKKTGMSRQTLAELLDVSISTIAMYERNHRTPPVSKIPTLATIFNVPIDFFFFYDPYLTANHTQSRYITLLVNYQKLDDEQQDIVDKLIQKFITLSSPRDTI